MCGIFGLVISGNHSFDEDSWHEAVRNLFELSESRGKEAAGIAIADGNSIVIHKDSVAVTKMLRTADYNNAVSRIVPSFFNNAKGQSGTLATIGHSRLVTNGLQGIDANNQPVWRDRNVIVHNGIVVNVDDLWANNDDIIPRADVDTEVIAALVEKHRTAGEAPADAIARVYGEIIGETSIALFFQDLNLLALATNTGSLYVAETDDGSSLLFVSEKYICHELTNGNHQIPAFNGRPCRQIAAGNGLLVNLDNLETIDFSLDTALPKPELAPRLAVQRRIEEKSEQLRAYRDNMRRCAKCLLPETMPFISYDEQGVCNYCQNYAPKVRKEEAELEAILEKYRKKDGSPDCLVAFSGGRDSCYGLHLLRTKYNMNPIAYTYDWGMVTDLGRRNQARMCGKLGIEHIWVSADIKKKRDYIRRNILAWMKKPDIGMIPLFMAGDKQFFWYANKLINQIGVPLMVFCTNHLEKTDFKTGFLGIPPKDIAKHTRPSTLGVASKLNLMFQYGRRLLANPAYLNRSLPDTVWAFFSYYGIKQDHLFLFDHIEWEEMHIENVLINEYDWETAPDTNCTWRIGDGTAPFYNYIYYTVAGFTEHDTFRSNQIREGMLSREAALQMVEEENQPRWDSFREYTRMLNIDFDELIRVIDRLPKLYVPED